MDKLMMQNDFFGYTEGTKKVSAGLKNTKIKIAKKRPISGRIALLLLLLQKKYTTFFQKCHRRMLFGDSSS